VYRDSCISGARAGEPIAIRRDCAGPVKRGLDEDDAPSPDGAGAPLTNATGPGAGIAGSHSWFIMR
jgi:hypothetical protein